MFNFFKKKSFQERDLKCPRCKVIMGKIRKKDVVIDHCRKCNGIWLDDNEIEKLVSIAKSKKVKKNVKKRK